MQMKGCKIMFIFHNTQNYEIILIKITTPMTILLYSYFGYHRINYDTKTLVFMKIVRDNKIVLMAI